jgi:hypothetical protein
MGRTLAGDRHRVAVYPVPLRDAVLRRFMAEASFWPDDPHYLSAIERGDVIYTSAIVQQVVQALIQVVFALNREYFPGEKKLADALEKLAIVPAGFAAAIEGLLCPGPARGVDELRGQQRALASITADVRRLQESPSTATATSPLRT